MHGAAYLLRTAARPQGVAPLAQRATIVLSIPPATTRGDRPPPLRFARRLQEACSSALLTECLRPERLRQQSPFDAVSGGNRPSGV